MDDRQARMLLRIAGVAGAIGLAAQAAIGPDSVIATGMCGLACLVAAVSGGVDAMVAVFRKRPDEGREE